MKRLLLCCLFAALIRPAYAGEFSSWAAIVVAGEWRAHSGAPSDVFDNGRAKITQELLDIGFSPGNVKQFSTQPERYPGVRTERSTPQSIATALWDLSNRTSGGCLAYFTSHGSPEGIALGDDVLSPRQMARMIDNACGGRPTVVVVSACFSGVFVPALKRPDRVVLTAAAADRPSFGCGETDRYTYFDTCAIQWLPKSGDFPTFGRDAIACVRAREKAEKVDEPSHPQLAVGTAVDAAIPHWK